EAHRRQRVAIVGATGAVGRELALLLVQAGQPLERIACSARRHDTLRVEGRDLSVQPLEPSTLAGTHVAFLCTPSEVSLALGAALVELGLDVIDLSSAFRLRADVPLIVPEINAHVLGARGASSANSASIPTQPRTG